MALKPEHPPVEGVATSGQKIVHEPADPHSMSAGQPAALVPLDLGSQMPGGDDQARLVPPLARSCGAIVLEQPFDDDLSGLLVELDGGAAIGVNAGQHEVRRRFTVAHELGHYLLNHHERFHIDLGRGDSDGTPPGYDWVSERAANDFAAELLMPARMVYDRYDGSQSTVELADDFGVSGLAIGYRLANLGLR